MSARTGTEVVPVATLDAALDGSDVLVLATKSSTPVLEASQLVAGTHISSIGATRPDQRELAPEIFGVCDEIVLDAPDLVAREAGDVIDANALGMLPRERVRSLSQLRCDGRRSTPGGTTLFKSVGTAIQDLVLALHVYEVAVAAGVGTALGSFPRLKPARLSPGTTRADT
jgi:ornithine cyclodeaminase/alanine dehydrogenase-like protein (mu-crystallin family)